MAARAFKRASTGRSASLAARLGRCPVDRRRHPGWRRRVGIERLTPSPLISLASRTRARSAALRAASDVGLPSASAISA